MYNMHVQGLFSESHMCVILYISLHRVQRKMPQMCNKRLCNQHIHESQTLNKCTTYLPKDAANKDEQRICKQLFIKTLSIYPKLHALSLSCTTYI